MVEWDLAPRRRSERELSIPLPAELRELIGSGPLAYLTTLNADGSPQVTAMWIGLEGDQIVSAHMRENLKVRNMKREPRVVLSFGPPRTGDWLSPHAVVYATASVERGTAAAALMNTLAPIYTGSEANLATDGEPGYLVRYSIDRIRGVGPWVDET